LRGSSRIWFEAQLSQTDAVKPLIRRGSESAVFGLHGRAETAGP
jgi:hypothetical protein